MDFDSQVRCHISITHSRIYRLLDPDGDSSDSNNQYLCSYHIDWGDGTSSDHAGGISSEVSPEFVSNGGWDGGANTSLSHSYADVGLYIVTLTVEEPDWKWNLDNNIISDNDNGSKYYAKAPQCVFAKIGGGFKNVGEDKDNFPLSTNAGMIATRKFIQTPTIRFSYGNFSLSTGAYTLKYIKSTMEDLTELGQVQFRDCYSLEKIEGVDFSLIKSIAASTFQSCATLKELSFENCTSVASAAFRQCISLRKIFLPNCTSIGDHAFYYCNSLEEIDLPSLTSAGSNPFPSGNASQITKIVLPVIQSINFSMRSCYCLLEVNCPNAASIVDSAFQQCRALHTVVVADGCTFGINCFNECFSLHPRPDGSIN